MRQVGYLAAAGRYALKYIGSRLAEDHLRAKAIGDVLSHLNYIENLRPVETNIVLFDVNANIENFRDLLKHFFTFFSSFLIINL